MSMSQGMPENLKVIHTSERGREVGLLARGVPKPGTSWNKQRYCNQRCVRKDKCSFISLSLTLPPDKLGRYPCYIKSQKTEVQEFFQNIFDKGEAGLVNVIIELYTLLWVKTKQAPTTKELADAIEVAIDMKKSIYGDKSKVEQTGESTIRVVWDEQEAKIE